MKTDHLLQADNGWLNEALCRDLPHAQTVVLSNTVVPNPAPLAERHIAVFCELCSYRPNIDVFAQLCVLHTYLCAHQVIVDSLFDGHAAHEHDILDAGSILGAVFERIRALATTTQLSGDLAELFGMLRQALASQRKALSAELEFRKNPLVPAVAEERPSIVGRASCALFVLRLVAKLGGRPLPVKIRRAIADYLFCAQLADDLFDWREDYQRHNHTSFLRLCYAELGRIPHENVLEEVVYLRGLYERRLVTVIRGLDAIAARFRRDAHSLPLTRSIILRERRRLLTILEDFVRVKVDFVR